MILLSFDIEEFDMPVEYGKGISFEEQMRISYEGTLAILQLLKRHKIQATFFCTANFAIHAPELVKKIISDGHEVASHGYFHSSFNNEDLVRSKETIEKITSKPVVGFRMARMMPVEESEVYNAGYGYNSSLNPTWIPGRYNNITKPRQMFFKEKIFQLPASVTPLLRFPLFWLSFHNLPLWLYKYLCLITHKADKYLNIYFHPWEFTELRNTQLGLPAFVKRNSGDKMLKRMESLILYFKKRDVLFCTIQNFINNKDR
ncbi:MAG TPA: polysaccharide deacetylase [Sphingobacteriaceae bacterium]|nr:polysaccharide deacetylase [Sphingobacteriaceae bacterium]